ncbi:MAG: hypothetical protein PF689_12715 [Deltaproteobacteria bacterium]|jgi:hypothetical protein|nr:hypothetical protein [Deltaproteobacteria bacterium]
MVKIKIWFFTGLVFSFLLSGCSWFVTRKEADQMKIRVEKISEELKQRRKEEKVFGEAIVNAKKELSKVSEARERYRKEQTAFIRKVHLLLSKLNVNIRTFEVNLASLKKKVDKTLKKEVEEIETIFKERAAELQELGKKFNLLIANYIKDSPQKFLKYYKAFAVAKEWKSLNRHLALMKLKYPSSNEMEEGLIFALKKLNEAKEYGKVIIYCGLYRRLFSQGPHYPLSLLMEAEAKYAIMNCSDAIKLLEEFSKKFPNHKQFSKVKKLQQDISSKLHSKMYCAK